MAWDAGMRLMSSMAWDAGMRLMAASRRSCSTSWRHCEMADGSDSMSPSPLYQGATQSSRDLSDPMAVAVAVEGSASEMTKSWRLGARRRCSLDLSLSHSRLDLSLSHSRL